MPKINNVHSVALVESVIYTGYLSKATNSVKFKTKDSSSNNGRLLSDDNSGNFTKFTVLQPCSVNLVYNLTFGSARSDTMITHYNSSGTVLHQVEGFYIQSGSTGGANQASMTVVANVGDYFVANETVAIPLDVSTSTLFSATAIRISL